MESIYEWLLNNALPEFWSFIKPMMPWMLISMVAPLVRYRLDKQLWLYNKKHHDTHDKPAFSKYRNTIMNCISIVSLAGVCKITFAPVLGITIVSSVLMVVIATVQLVKCVNSYLKIEEVGFRVDLFKVFKKSSFGEVVEKDEKQ